MANTYVLIASNTLSTTAASVTFSTIPATYTDLVVKFSARVDGATTGQELRLRTNSDTGSNYSVTVLRGSGSAASSYRDINVTYTAGGRAPGTSSTSNVFSNVEIYIPNYAGTANKPISLFSALEDNAATISNNIVLGADLHRNASAITSVDISPTSGNFVSGSSFFLYGIKNS
jgi:hypothetical protein